MSQDPHSAPPEVSADVVRAHQAELAAERAAGTAAAPATQSAAGGHHVRNAATKTGTVTLESRPEIVKPQEKVGVLKNLISFS